MLAAYHGNAAVYVHPGRKTEGKDASFHEGRCCEVPAGTRPRHPAAVPYSEDLSPPARTALSGCARCRFVRLWCNDLPKNRETIHGFWKQTFLNLFAACKILSDAGKIFEKKSKKFGNKVDLWEFL